MNKDNLFKKFSEIKTCLEMKRLLISLFEGSKFEKTNKGIEDFKKYLESNIPNINQLITKNTQGTGNGIIEILEDHLSKDPN